MAHTTVISVEVLQHEISNDDWIVFDCRFDLADPLAGFEAYRAGHLPGAHYANLDTDLASEVGPRTGRHPLPDPAVFARWLGERGVRPGAQVVVYDAQGGAIAARLWWLLRWCGHDAVALLDGGFKSWCDAGFSLATDEPAPRASQPYPTRMRSHMAVDVQALQTALAADKIRLLDARAPVRFRGEKEPLDPVAGHVPGAVNHAFNANLDADGRFLSADALRERFAPSLGSFAAQDTVCMCGSGVTACHNLVAMEIAGLSGARLYPGSWSEWIRDPDRPIAAGD